MIHREYRRYALTPLERERLEKRECPVCGCAREAFKPRNRNAVCCCPDHSETYWHEQRPTRDGMRCLVHKEQLGLCAHCKEKIILDWRHPYVLDHITPIAMGGSQWDRDNLQVLCEKCNKWKTAKDMGKIAAWKRHDRPVLTGQQKTLF